MSDWLMLPVIQGVCSGQPAPGGSLTGWSKGVSRKAERRGHLMWPKPQGQDPRGARAEAGLPVHTAGNPSVPEGKGRQGIRLERELWARKALPCPRIDGRAGVLLTLSESLRFVSQARNLLMTGSSVKEGIC